MASQDPVSGKNPGGTIKQIALAFELPFMVVAPVLLGGGIGYLLDRWLHSSPVLMLLGGLLGFGGGVWDMLRRLACSERKSRTPDGR